LADHGDTLKRWAARSGYKYENGEAAAYQNITGHCINIGAGSFSHPRWTNLDVNSDHYKSVQKGFVDYNLIEMIPMPFEEKSVSLAYSSHTIEHVKDNHIRNMLSEVWRVLELGGVLRIACPNADLFYEAAKLNNWNAFSFRKQHWWTRHGYDLDDVSPIDYLVFAFALTANPGQQPLKLSNPNLLHELEKKFDEMTKEEFLNDLTSRAKFDVNFIHGHINWWNYDKLDRLLKEVGFEIVYPSAFGASIAAPMRNVQKFDNTVPEETLFVEAVKTPVNRPLSNSGGILEFARRSLAALRRASVLMKSRPYLARSRGENPK